MSAPFDQAEFTHIRSRKTALAAETPQMLVAGIIPDRKVVLAWGETGCGKTYWMAEIITAVVMRRPAFGRFAILPDEPERAPGIGVIFAGEDAEYVEQSRLVAIEQHYEQLLEGLVYTVQSAIPAAESGRPAIRRKAMRDELKRLQDVTGKRIEIIGNDTLKRSLGTMSQNDDTAARQFNDVTEGLAEEFRCTVLSNAHQPKYGAEGRISGSGDFIDGASVTPHLEAVRIGTRLVGIKCTFEPKFRIGLVPDTFQVQGIPVMLPARVGINDTDLVFVHQDGSIVSAPTGKDVTAMRCDLVRTTLLSQPEREFTGTELGDLLAKQPGSDQDAAKWVKFIGNRDKTTLSLFALRLEQRGSMKRDTRIWGAKRVKAAGLGC